MAEAAPEDGSAARGELARHAGLTALGTLGSRLLGAVRDAVIAASFAIASTDAFFVAWTIPNTLRRILGEGAVAAAFIPVFSELDERQGRSEARRYFARFAGTLLGLLLLVSLAGVLTARLWATLYGGGYRNDPGKFETTVELTELVFPYILFAGFAALLSGTLNALGRFLLPSFSPALLNVALVAAPLLFVPLAREMGLQDVSGLALAALVGGALQVLVQMPALRRAGMLPAPRLAPQDPAVRRSLGLMLPLLFGTGVHQLNILLSRLLASFLPSGSQSFLYYGQRLVEIPQGMFAMAVATAALPSLSRLRSQQKHDQALSTLRYGMQLTLFIAVPASVALAALSLPTVTVVFGRGEFSPAHALQTARSLVWLAAGVWAVALSHAVTRMYYAYNDTRTPVWCGAANLLVFVALGLVSAGRFGHVGLAAATTAGATAQLALLLLLLRPSVGPIGARPLLVSAGRCLAASLVMGVVIRDLATLGAWEAGGNDPRNLALYVGIALFGLAVYVAASYLLGSPELSELGGALRKRLGRKRA
ncbi:MAG: murein biosynthesis integral membrane protein MurJ [Myxococcales bacterium]|jgi:putative peptidoglycan lipid II flippase